MNRYPCIAMATVLASCAATTDYQDALKSWVGAQEVELLRHWGQPVQSFEKGGRKSVVYVSRRSLQLPGTASANTSAGAIAGSPAMSVELFCTTTFELENFKVVSASYKGNGCEAKKLPRFGV